MWVYWIFGLLSLTGSGFLFYRVITKHKNVNANGIGSLEEVIDLGRSGVKKLFALVYYIREGDKEIKIVKTPVRRPKKIGKQKIIYYQEDDAQNNYYFGLFGKQSLDERFILPILLAGIATVLIVGGILAIFR